MKILEHLGLQDEVRYLLGYMPDGERDAFRNRILSESGAADRVREAENELFDAYARGELPPAARQSVERRLLPGNRHRLAVARVLGAKTGSSATRWLFAAAAMLLIVFAASTLTRRPTGPPLAILTLQAVTRSAAARIPSLTRPESGEIELRAPVTKPSSYRVELKTARGADVRAWDAIAATTEVRVRIAVSLLPVGSYELTVLESGSPVGFHDFRVTQP